MFERFTREGREVVVSAERESREQRHGHIGTEHLLLALLDPASGIPAQVLAEAGVSAEQVRADVARLARPTGPVLGEEDAAALGSIGIDLAAVVRSIEASFGPDALRPPAPTARRGLFRRRRVQHRRFTPRARTVLPLALREAIRLGHREIGSPHLLLGLLREGRGMGVQVLVGRGVDLGLLRAAVESRLVRAA